MVRVLIVDDSVAVRHMLRVMLGRDPELEVVGAARDGREALREVDEKAPDVMVLDLEMPVCGGMEVLNALKERPRRPPVVVFSKLTEEGTRAAVDALAAGAADCVVKPTGGREAAERQVREVLIPRIKALAGGGKSGGRNGARQAAPAAETEGRDGWDGWRAAAVVIGASTGGPEALRKVLRTLPARFPAPVLIVQHMPPVFTRQLAERLDRECRLPVREGKEGAAVRPGEVWIAPGDYHMEVEQRRGDVILRLNQHPPENSVRPAADPLFRTAARIYGGKTLAVVLTGMGCDGREGARAVRAAGGRIIAQDERTSVVWGMPGAVVAARIAHRVLGIDSIGAVVVQAVLGERAQEQGGRAVPALRR